MKLYQYKPVDIATDSYSNIELSQIEEDTADRLPKSFKTIKNIDNCGMAVYEFHNKLQQ